MCRVLKVSKSGYYKYLKKSAKEQFELENKLKLIEEIYKSSRCTYGSRKVPKSLKAKGISCYKNQIAKIMKQEGLFAKGRNSNITRLGGELANTDLLITRNNIIFTILTIVIIKTQQKRPK